MRRLTHVRPVTSTIPYRSTLHSRSSPIRHQPTIMQPVGRAFPPARTRVSSTLQCYHGTLRSLRWIIVLSTCDKALSEWTQKVRPLYSPPHPIRDRLHCLLIALRSSQPPYLGPLHPRPLVDISLVRPPCSTLSTLAMSPTYLHRRAIPHHLRERWRRTLPRRLSLSGARPWSSGDMGVPGPVSG